MQQLQINKTYTLLNKPTDTLTYTLTRAQTHAPVRTRTHAREHTPARPPTSKHGRTHGYMYMCLH